MTRNAGMETIGLPPVISGQPSEVTIESARPPAQPSTPPASVNRRTGLGPSKSAAWIRESGTGANDSRRVRPRSRSVRIAPAAAPASSYTPSRRSAMVGRALLQLAHRQHRQQLHEQQEPQRE